MDRNLLLAFALSFLVLSLWSMLHEPPPRPESAAVERAPGDPGDPAAAREPAGRASSGEVAERYPELPDTQAARRAGDAPPLRERGRERGAEEPPQGSELRATEGQLVEVTRAKYRATLDSRGATVREWRLREFTDRHRDPIMLVWSGEFSPAVVTPFVELGHGDLADAVWSVERADGDEVVFTLSRDGVRLRKRYAFDEEGYGFRLSLDVENRSDAAVAPAFLVEWPIAEHGGNDFREQSLAALHEGSLEYTPLGSLGSAGFFGFFTGRSDGEPEVYRGEVDWAGVQTPYFLAALFPDQPARANARFLALEKGKRGVAQLYFDPVEVPPGQSATREFRGYAGPKEIERLEAFAPTAVASIDLGWSVIAPLTRGFTWLLHAIYTFIPNYGWAIILLTILVRLVTAPLTVKQMRSMERMRRIQPKMKEIQEKYADDRQKQSEEMMRLYRQEKVNPLGGCFPMLLQLPVFIGLFYALRSSIDLRQAPFFGWIDDLSAPDTLFVLPGLEFPVRVLPLVMGASMFFQQKITPMQMDPAQARMMLTIMPVMMTVISYTFPSGLVLYWMMSNVLAISHQLWIGRNMTPSNEKGGKGSKEVTPATQSKSAKQEKAAR